MSKTKRRLILVMAVYGLITLACSKTNLSVANQSDYKVLVSVTLPGASGADSHIYLPGEVHDYNAGSGGSYTISVIPQEDYVAAMDKIRENIILTLYSYQDVIRPKYVVELTEKLANIDRTLSSLTAHACSGNLMEESNVMATINITNEGKIELYCPSLVGPEAERDTLPGTAAPTPSRRPHGRASVHQTQVRCRAR